ANWPFAKVDINAKDDAKTWQIRDQESLVKAVGKEGAAQVPKLFKVKAIDFKKHMIIAVSAGTKPSGGYRVEIVDVLKIEADNPLTVRCILPPPEGVATDAFTHPASAVLVNQWRAGPRVSWTKAPKKE